MSDPNLPFRPNVGIALFNRAGLVFAGRALGDGPDRVDPGREWQMPQGGIDPDEDIVAAARRELREETGITAASLLAVTDPWWTYDFPPYHGPPHRLCVFRGQMQRWAAFRFDGDEGAIDVAHPPDGNTPEFSDWAWMPLAALPDLVMPHKRTTYLAVLDAFGRFTHGSADGFRDP